MQEVRTTNLTIKQMDDLLEGQLTQILQGLADEAEALGAGDDTIPRLLTGHFTVEGAITGSERGVMLGRDVKISRGLLADPVWDYVALGHIHKHQNLTEGRSGVPPIVYSGSLERIDFGEEGDPKGFCYVQLERHQTQWEFVPVNARPMVTLRVDCRQDPHPTPTVLKLLNKHDLTGAIVRLFVQLTPQSDAVFKDVVVREKLSEMGVFHLGTLKRDIERPERTRLSASPEGMTHEQLLEQYLLTKSTPPDRREELLSAARELMHEI
jgi:exonuclease SbcD